MMTADFDRKLTIPVEAKAMYPLSPALAETVRLRAAEIRDVLTSRSDKLLLIIGPCSADREDSVLEYLNRLRRLQDLVTDRIFIIPRLYTTKPRSTGDGYMGPLHQPDPDEQPDLFRGIVYTREFHLLALSETGFSCADEMLYPENLKYLDDLLAYVAVGARSVEDQQHRLTASALDIPVGMKNPVGGNLEAMLNAVSSAQHGHDFIYRGWQARSHGNPLAHAVLRGYTDRFGRAYTNYHYEDLMELYDAYASRGLLNPAVIVDTNHANSGKRFEEQIRIAQDVMNSRRRSAELLRLVKGLMIESYLEDGAQAPGDGRYGMSITDPCLGWDKTERLVLDLAELV